MFPFALFIALLLAPSAHATSETPPSLRDPRVKAEVCAAYLAALRNPATFDRIAEDGPYQKLAKTFGPGIVDPSNPHSLSHFENDVLSFFEVDPSLRDLDYLTEKWKMSRDEITDVLLYYGVEIFDSDLRILSSDPSQSEARLRELKPELTSRAPASPGAKANRAYYEDALAIKSIPEMAKELGITEHSVRRQLSELDLSVAEAFARKRGGPGVGEDQASRFFRHYLGEERRDIGWDRVMIWQGRPFLEEELLVRFRREGVPRSEIAARLNELAHVTDPTSPLHRTEGSVQGKLGTLGFALGGAKPKDQVAHYLNRYEHQRKLVDIAVAGLRQTGRLPTIEELRALGGRSDYFDQARQAFSGLRNFWLAVRKQAHDEKVPFNLLWLTKNPHGAPDDRFQKALQQDALNLAEAWIQKNERHFTMFEIPLEGLPFRGPRLVSTSEYAPGKGMYGIFASSTDFYRDLIAHSKQNGNEVLIFNISEQDIDSGLRNLQRQQLIEVAVDWSVRHGRLPITTLDFAPSPTDRPVLKKDWIEKNGPLPLAFGKAFSKHGIFSNSQQFYLALMKQLPDNAKGFHFLDILFDGDYSPEYRARLQREAIVREAQWIKANGGKLPLQRDYGDEEGKIRVSYTKVNGQYPNPARSFFNSAEEHREALQRYCDEEGIRIVHKTKGYTSEERERLQEEALSIEAAWVHEHDGRMPRQGDYGSKEGQIPLNYAKLNGGKVAIEAGLHIFSSYESHKAALERRCDEMGIGYESR